MRTAEQCNFALVGGTATGTYRFRTGFYGLADMPAEFQQAIDKVLMGTKGTHAFVDDILICTKGSQSEHLKEVNKVLEKLDKANVGLNIEKCQYMKEQIQWLGFELTQTGTRPLESEIESIMNMKEPKTLKQLRGLMGSAHQLIKFIPKLATLCTPFRPLLKSTSKYKWGTEQDQAFGKLKQAIKEVT